MYRSFPISLNRLAHFILLVLLSSLVAVSLEAEDKLEYLPKPELSADLLSQPDPLEEAKKQRIYLSKVFTADQLAVIQNIPKDADDYLLRQKQNEFMAKVFDIKENSHEFEKLMAGKIGWGWKNRGKNRKVLKIIKGKEGISFPTGDEIEKKHKIPEEQKIEMMAKYRAWQDLQRKKQEAQSKERLKICSRNRTIKEKLKLPKSKKLKLSKRGSKEVKFDILVINREDIPKKYKQIFGRKTKILPYFAEPDARQSVYINHLKAECLPYRLRVVGNKVYRHEGLDALKNYDLSDRGKLHESMKYMREYLKIQRRGL